MSRSITLILNGSANVSPKWTGNAIQLPCFADQTTACANKSRPKCELIARGITYRVRRGSREPMFGQKIAA